MARLSDLIRNALVGGASDDQRKLELQRLKVQQEQLKAQQWGQVGSVAGSGLAAIPGTLKQLGESDGNGKSSDRLKALDQLAEYYQPSAEDYKQTEVKPSQMDAADEPSLTKPLEVKEDKPKFSFQNLARQALGGSNLLNKEEKKAVAVGEELDKKSAQLYDQANGQQRGVPPPKAIEAPIKRMMPEAPKASPITEQNFDDVEFKINLITKENPKYNTPGDRARLRSVFEEQARNNALERKKSVKISQESDKLALENERNKIGTQLTLSKDEFLKAARDLKADAGAKDMLLEDLDQKMFSNKDSFEVYSKDTRLKLYSTILDDVVKNLEDRRVTRFISAEGSDAKLGIDEEEMLKGLRKTRADQVLSKHINAFKNKKDIEGKPLPAPDLKSIELTGDLYDKIDKIEKTFREKPELLTDYARVMKEYQLAQQTAKQVVTRTEGKTGMEGLLQGTTRGGSTNSGGNIGGQIGNDIAGASAGYRAGSSASQGEQNALSTQAGKQDLTATQIETDVQKEAANKILNDPSIDPAVKEAFRNTVDVSFLLGQSKQNGIMTDKDAARFDLVQMPYGKPSEVYGALSELKNESAKIYVDRVENRENEFNVPANIIIRKDQIYDDESFRKLQRYKGEGKQFFGQKQQRAFNKSLPVPDITDKLLDVYGLSQFKPKANDFAAEDLENADVTVWKNDKGEVVQADPKIQLERRVLDALGFKPVVDVKAEMAGVNAKKAAQIEANKKAEAAAKAKEKFKKTDAAEKEIESINSQIEKNSQRMNDLSTKSVDERKLEGPLERAARAFKNPFNRPQYSAAEKEEIGNLNADNAKLQRELESKRKDLRDMSVPNIEAIKNAPAQKLKQPEPTADKPTPIDKAKQKLQRKKDLGLSPFSASAPVPATDAAQTMVARTQEQIDAKRNELSSIADSHPEDQTPEGKRPREYQQRERLKNPEVRKYLQEKEARESNKTEPSEPEAEYVPQAQDYLQDIEDKEYRNLAIAFDVLAAKDPNIDKVVRKQVLSEIESAFPQGFDPDAPKDMASLPIVAKRAFRKAIDAKLKTLPKAKGSSVPSAPKPAVAAAPAEPVYPVPDLDKEKGTREYQASYWMSENAVALFGKEREAAIRQQAARSAALDFQKEYPEVKDLNKLTTEQKQYMSALFELDYQKIMQNEIAKQEKEGDNGN